MNLGVASGRKRLVSFFLVLSLSCFSATRANAFAPINNIKSSSRTAFTQLIRKPNRPQTNKAECTPMLTNRGGSSSSTSRGMANLIFDGGPFWKFQSIIAGFNLLGFGISVATGSHLHLDLLGTGAFAVAALPQFLQTLGGGGGELLRIKLSSAAVVAWGTKLAGFLFFRALKIGNDGRLEEMLSTTSGTVKFWVSSALWGVVCSLPHTLGTTSNAPGNPIGLKIGAAMFVVGLVTESLADYQKWGFKQTNPGQFCNVGLWSMSQHPNFFGNLLLWAGIFVMNAPSLIEPVAASAGILARILSYKRLAVAFLGPWFMWTLFSGQANGSITTSIDLANAKYGENPIYQEYIKNVPKIFPNPFKK